MNQLVAKYVLALIVVGVMLQAACLPGDSISGQNVGCDVLSPAMLLNAKRQDFLDVDLCDKSMSNTCARTAQLALVTNVVLSVTSYARMGDGDVEAGVSMVRWILDFPAVKADKRAFLYCAKAISEIRPVSTNDYSRELRIAYEMDLALTKGEPRRPGTVSRTRYWGPNRKAFELKWGPVLEHNRNCENLRCRAIEVLSSRVSPAKESSSVQGEESMPELIGRINGFSEEEKSMIIGRQPSTKETNIGNKNCIKHCVSITNQLQNASQPLVQLELP